MIGYGGSVFQPCFFVSFLFSLYWEYFIHHFPLSGPCLNEQKHSAGKYVKRTTHWDSLAFFHIVGVFSALSGIFYGYGITITAGLATPLIKCTLLAEDASDSFYIYNVLLMTDINVTNGHRVSLQDVSSSDWSLEDSHWPHLQFTCPESEYGQFTVCIIL